jgi:hypothetical protein
MIIFQIFSLLHLVTSRSPIPQNALEGSFACRVKDGAFIDDLLLTNEIECRHLKASAFNPVHVNLDAKGLRFETCQLVLTDTTWKSIKVNPTTAYSGPEYLLDISINTNLFSLQQCLSGTKKFKIKRHLVPTAFGASWGDPHIFVLNDPDALPLKAIGLGKRTCSYQ